MPWKMGDATGFTKKADTPGKKRQFAAVANAVLKKSGDEGKAIKIANAAVKKSKKPAPAARVFGALKAKQTKQVRGE